MINNYLTQDESAELKQRLKRHWRLWGYDAPLPNDLAAVPNKYPCEWAEACQEWERQDKNPSFHPPKYTHFDQWQNIDND